MYAQQLRRFFWKARFWNSAYGVVTAAGHASIEQLLEHIQDQERPP
jgi:REP element-mobilizing transposase RayT